MTRRLDDGFSTIISLGTTGAVRLYEKEVTPPGIDGGSAIPTSTMRNVRYRTFSPRALITLTPCTFQAAYDPQIYLMATTNINVNQLITVTFPDGSNVQFWGSMEKIIPGQNNEGTQPITTVTITPTNRDNATPPAEVAPVYNGS